MPYVGADCDCGNWNHGANKVASALIAGMDCNALVCTGSTAAVFAVLHQRHFLECAIARHCQ